ncbi:NUDIX hydrolase [Anaerobacillus isosaccharinicus]|uniref:NUDIX domain-containing protein n=1 Tax=Anaerobacillus isosaccharinicus TaxID=1532552 RepID=A0A1S2LFE3_9BACI|nr:NUDIX domain-containing protein [Anaerobacillus isosaccharinicus]MBA5586275.1 NUDIX domain-containing protein [Anaerobacillus isosaccharinicus]QOY35473.1 NUDIX domain-containing protein [Anaerobacillus isosaccharinicus]
MSFEVALGIQRTEHHDVKVKFREAVRAVIIDGDKILLVHSNLGDYKFPGGGLMQNESHSEALIREIAEETGYLSTLVGDKVGVIIEKQIDEYDQDAIFQMTSHYYRCNLQGERGKQNLDDYELQQEYTPKWVHIDDAIKQNQKMIQKFPQNGWIHRENYVLMKLKKQQIHMD